MDLWVIDYALHLKSMKEAEYSRDDVAGFCAEVNACLAARGFEKHESLGFHASARVEALSNAYLACADLSTIAGSNQFISKLNLFRVKGLTDLLPVLSMGKVASRNDGMDKQIDAEYLENTDSSKLAGGITMASTVAAIVRDLFLDETEPHDRQPQFAAKEQVPSRKAS